MSGLTVELTRRYFPDADETIIETMSQKSKNMRCTKIKNIEEKEITLNYLNDLMKDASTKIEKSNEAHVFIRHSSKLHSDQTGKFTHSSMSRNQCMMIIFIVDTNVM